MSDLYADLGVDKSASPDEIKKAYRKGVKANHPDHGGDKEKFGALARAYEVLGNQARRERYDNTGDTNGGDPAEVLEREAMQVTIQAIQAAVGGADIERTDIIGSALATLMQSRASLEAQKLTTLMEQARISKVMKRLKRKKAGTDMVMDMLRAAHDGFSPRIASLDHVMEVHDRALEIIGDYTYEVDRPQSAYMGNPMMDQNFMRGVFGDQK